MPLDSEEDISYTVNGSTETPRPNTCVTVESEADDEMIVFLSFPHRGRHFGDVVSTLQARGLTVLTNFDRSDSLDPQRRTDLRLSRIRRSDVFVFFAPSVDLQNWSLVRQIEFGYALGQEIPVVYVGRVANSLHSYGDVFDSVSDFLAGFYSDDYNEQALRWLSGEIAVA